MKKRSNEICSNEIRLRQELPVHILELVTYAAGANLFYTMTLLAPCWSLLEFWKVKLKNSSSTKWIFSLQNPFWNGFLQATHAVGQTWFFQIDFPEIKYRSTGRQAFAILLALGPAPEISLRYITLFKDISLSQFYFPGLFSLFLIHK